MWTDELDFDLPPELIAQHPVTPRDASRLMRYQRASKEVSHHVFRDLPELLRRGDLLVFNDAKVLPAKFTLIRPTGGRVGGLFLEEPRAGEWIALLKGLGPVRPDAVYRFEDSESEIRDQKSEISRKRESASGPLSRRERVVGVVAEGDRVRGQPSFQFDALLTNFHLPRSTLIALVAALVGLEEQRRLYRLAIEDRYRFFSYGDSMLLE